MYIPLPAVEVRSGSLVAQDRRLTFIGFSWDATYETLTADGACTACEVTQDHSAYWTPIMNFAYDNGTTVMVPQVGGMLVYVT